MNITKTLKMLMVDKNIKQTDVANEFKGMSKNTFNNLLRRNDYKLNDIIKIAEIMDYDVKLQFVDKKNGKQWLCEPNEDNNDLQDNNP